MRFRDDVTIGAGIILTTISLPFLIWSVCEMVINNALLALLIQFSIFTCFGLLMMFVGMNRIYVIDNERIGYKFFNKKITIKKDDVLVIKSTNTKNASIYIIPNTISVDYLVKIKPKILLRKNMLLTRKGCICINETKKVIKCLNDFGYRYDKNDLV